LTASSAGICFSKRGGNDLELWVEKNEAAIPRRLIVTYRLLPGQPSFIAEFTNWDSRVRPSDSVFAFQAPSKVAVLFLKRVGFCACHKARHRAELSPLRGASPRESRC
jgi:hypothetical protein